MPTCGSRAGVAHRISSRITRAVRRLPRSRGCSARWPVKRRGFATAGAVDSTWTHRNASADSGFEASVGSASYNATTAETAGKSNTGTNSGPTPNRPTATGTPRTTSRSRTTTGPRRSVAPEGQPPGRPDRASEGSEDPPRATRRCYPRRGAVTSPLSSDLTSPTFTWAGDDESADTLWDRRVHASAGRPTAAGGPTQAEAQVDDQAGPLRPEGAPARG